MTRLQFPGNNELDQIKKIHNIVGTPPSELLQRLKRLSSHMDCNFAPQQGMGIEKLIPHVPADCIDLINRCLPLFSSRRPPPPPPVLSQTTL